MRVAEITSALSFRRQRQLDPAAKRLRSTVVAANAAPWETTVRTGPSAGNQPWLAP